MINMPIRKSILILIIIAACLASYFNALFGDFVWDDNTFFATKEYNKSFKFLPQFFFSDFTGVYDKSLSSGYYRPLLALFFMLNYVLWGSCPIGYHLFNLIFHILSCILIFTLVEMLIKNRVVAFSSSLLFGVHPVHTEAVSFISNVSYVSATFFFILSIILFLHYAKNKSLIFYFCSLACFVVSLLTIESAIILPFLLASIDYLFLSQSDIKKFCNKFFKFYSGFIITIVLYLILRSYVVEWDFICRRALGQVNFSNGESAFWRALTSLKIFYYYIRLLFFPYNLRVEYFFASSDSILEIPVLAGSAILISLILIVVNNSRRNPILSLSIVWFLITLFPMSNLLPIGNLFAERYLYIPSIGFCIGIGFLLFWLMQHNFRTSFINWKISITLIFVLIIIIFGKTTYERNSIWADELSLWYDAVKKSPESSRAHCNLASAYYNLGFLDNALNEIEVSISLQPFSCDALFTKGTICLKKGLNDEAIEAFNSAIGIMPDHSASFVGLSAAYFMINQYQKSIDTALTALQKNPYLDEARYNLGLSYSYIGKVDEAIDMYEQYLKNNPGYLKAHMSIAELYQKKGNKEKAIEHYFSVINIDKNCQPAKDALKLLE
jgi:tetratricopeptide (TPR) repeat protein